MVGLIAVGVNLEWTDKVMARGHLVLVIKEASSTASLPFLYELQLYGPIELFDIFP